MIPSQKIRKTSAGRGGEFNAGASLTEFHRKLAAIEVCKHLFPENRERDRYFDKKHVGCSRENLHNGNETAFSRALFNQRFLSLNGQLSILLDYEAVLSNHPKQKVDLLAYKVFENTIVAIEYKFNPFHENTGLEYGLFEAYSYGFLLEKHLSSNKSALHDMKRRFHELGFDQFTQFIPDTPPRSEYLLSAPASYFNEFARTDGRAGKRFSRIKDIESCLKDKKTSRTSSIFLGYLPIAEVSHRHCVIIDSRRSSVSYPFLMTVQESIEAIRESVRTITMKKPS